MQSTGRGHGVTVTNDGATILKSLHIDNPAAKVLVGILDVILLLHFTLVKFNLALVSIGFILLVFLGTLFLYTMVVVLVKFCVACSQVFNHYRTPNSHFMLIIMN